MYEVYDRIRPALYSNSLKNIVEHDCWNLLPALPKALLFEIASQSPGASKAPKALQRLGARGRCFNSRSTAVRVVWALSESLGFTELELLEFEQAQHWIPSSLRAAAMT